MANRLRYSILANKGQIDSRFGVEIAFDEYHKSIYIYLYLYIA